MSNSILTQSVYTYSKLRSLNFTLQYVILDAFSNVKRDPELRKPLEKSLLSLLKNDAENIDKGYYPLSVLKPEHPLEHLKRIPRIVIDGIGLYLRRMKGNTSSFSPKARELLEDLPHYYRRNFHFQTDGYLSEHSAEIYEHQVELLFGGAADAMRRLCIPMLKKHFDKQKDGEGLTFLEIAAGTGRTSRFVKLAFPKAKIIVSDLSEAYVKNATKRLTEFRKLDFVQADAAKLPFQDGHFDAVYSVFLFHELPLEERKKVLKECARVLKKTGITTHTDSLQKTDSTLFRPLLESFPKNFHEPFYRNYTENSMENLITQSGLDIQEKQIGFFSKALSATHGKK